MMQTQGWLIYIKKLRETSAYVVFFTENQGIVKAFGKGTRAKFGSLLQPFTPLWLSFQKKNDKTFLNNIELQGMFPITNKLGLCIGFYMNELLLTLHAEEELDSELYKNYQEVLIRMHESVSSFELHYALRSFETRLLQLIGYGMDNSVNSFYRPVFEKNAFYKLTINGFEKTQNGQGFSGDHLIKWFQKEEVTKEVLSTTKQLNRQLIDIALHGKTLHSRKLMMDFFEICKTEE